MTRVLDYSVGRPDPAAIVAAGYSGVMRYVAPMPMDQAKVITAAEYAALKAVGLQVGLNWEWYAARAREGAAAGTADALATLQQANDLGYPSAYALYFSVDFDAAESDQPAIDAYFQAINAVIGLDRTGAYGGYWVLKRLFDGGFIRYGWQTVAWSGTNRESRAHLLQDTFGLFGGDADGNEVLQSNWLGGSMVPKGSLVGYIAGTDFDDSYSGNTLATTFGLSYPDIVAIDDGQGHSNAWMNGYDPAIPGNYHGHTVYLPGFQKAPPPAPPPAASDADVLVATLKKVFPHLA